MRHNKKRSQERGQAMIESALTLLVYLTFVLSTLELSQTLFLLQTYSDRARHALRMVCVQPYNSATSETTLQNWVMYNQATVPSGANSSQGYLGIRRSSISLIATLPGTSANLLTVRISNYAFSLISFALVGRNTSYTGRTIQYSHTYEQPIS
jgi:hypothetical protein